MANIGENRLKIYSMLYDKPMCNCIKNKQLNVAIVGDEAIALEALKAVFWCGQYPKSHLNIYLISESSEIINDFKSLLGNESSSNEYATFMYSETDYSKLSGEAIEYLNKSNYIIVASETKHQTIENSLTNAGYTVHNVSEYSKNPDLLHMACNINFMYDRIYNPYISRYDSIKKLIGEGCQTEEQIEYPKAYLDANNADDFSDNKTLYNLDSSLASAVHTKYKLNYINDNSPKIDEYFQIYRFIEETKPKSKNYKILTHNEHCRWLAYMITLGYKYPDKFQKQSLYDQMINKDKKTKTHLCICMSDENGPKLNDEIWHKFEDKKGEESKENSNPFDYKDLCQLDQLSLEYHKELGERLKSKKENIESALTSLPERNGFRSAAENLIDNAQGASKIYKSVFEMLSMSPSLPPTEKEKFCKIDEKLTPFKEYNERRDFFDIDAEIINMIPICLWLGKKYKHIITVMDEFIPSAVILPWLLSIQEPIFVFTKKTDEETKKRITDFFTLYGKIKPIYHDNMSFDLNKVDKNAESILNKYGDAIINIVDSTPHAFIYYIANKNINCVNHPILTLTKKGKIESYNKAAISPATNRNRYLKIFDYISLMGGNNDDVDRLALTCNQVEKIQEVFWESIKDNTWNTELAGDHLTQYIDNERKITIPQEKVPTNLMTFVKALANAGIVKQDEQDYYKIIDENAMKVFTAKSGTFFEYLVYYRFMCTGYINDYRIGSTLHYESKSDTKNEIDVIVMNKTSLIFISCKATKEINNNYLNEIYTEAQKYNALPVLAVSINKKDIGTALVNRAKTYGITIVDREALMEQEEFNKFYGGLII